MAILRSIDYSKFERFSNVADEISANLLSSFLEYEVLVGVTDPYDFEFSIKAAERKSRTEDSIHIQEIGIIDNRNVISKLIEQENQPGKNCFPKIERNNTIPFNLLSNHLFGKS